MSGMRFCSCIETLRPDSLAVFTCVGLIFSYPPNTAANISPRWKVFPGGNYDKKQDESFPMTAIRETFEESGLLIASSADSSGVSPDDSVLDEAREAIHSEKISFQSFLARYGLKADVASLLPFTEWITPPNSQARYVRIDQVDPEVNILNAV